MKGDDVQFVKLMRHVLESDGWRRLGINARRFIDFLMIEHMRKGGQQNGLLLAPRRELCEFGIGEHYVSDAISEAESAGLVVCTRGVGRRPSLYALTWLPIGVSKQSAVASAKQHPQTMSAVSAQNECQTALTKPVASAKRHSQSRKSMSAKQHSPSRRSYHSGDNLSVEGSNGSEAGRGAIPADDHSGMAGAPGGTGRGHPAALK